LIFFAIGRNIAAVWLARWPEAAANWKVGIIFMRLGARTEMQFDVESVIRIRWLCPRLEEEIKQFAIMFSV
jgi:hypothetical protein